MGLTGAVTSGDGELGGGEVSTGGKVQLKEQPVPSVRAKIRTRKTIKYFPRRKVKRADRVLQKNEFKKKGFEKYSVYLRMRR